MDYNRPIVKLLLVILFGYICFEVKPGFCLGDSDATCIKTEKEALLKFKQGLKDPSGRLISWFGEDCCKWVGVICNKTTGRVVKLKLRNLYPDSVDDGGIEHALGGKINPSLLHLKHLNYLDLSMNNFGGIQIPNFIGSLENLRYLNLSGASFGGIIPPNIGNLSSLVYLDLSNYFNEANDNDLQWLPGLGSLKYLNLDGVDISKATTYWLQTVNMLPSLLELHLPSCGLSVLPPSLPFVNLTSLLVLDLSNNGFNSTIPHWLFNLSSLTHLDLKANSLQGELPDALGNLASLQELDVSYNYNIHGQLSRNLAKLCNLQMLKLSVNNISGELTDFVDGLSGCTNSSLETLDLGYNKLSGNLPDSLGYLKKLRFLQLVSNAFKGSIPKTIGNLSSLEQLYLDENQMNGAIPESLGQLSALVVLQISENKWEGVITEAHLENLSSLEELYIGKTSPNISLVFNISSDWESPFKLTFINIRSCQLGPKFPTWLRNQKNLKTVVLNNARISGTIPDWFWALDLQLDELDFAYNQLSGRVPNSLKFNYLSTVDLSSNNFEGPLPMWSSNVSKLYLRDDRFSGPIPHDIGSAMPILTDLDISHNSLNGSIPLSISNMLNLTTLVISNNHLTGEIPQFWSNLPFLYIVDMSNNSLVGTIPRSIGSLFSLRFLILSKNNLSGELPSSLQNCTDMDSLDLGDNNFSGNLPAWIGERMTSLSILGLRSNSFGGNIPSEICSLSTLHILDLSHNNMFGIIPPCIGNLTGLQTEFLVEGITRYEGRLELVTKGREYEYMSTLYLVNSIDLSSNNLSGEIPREISNLVKLGTLNLSRNHLTGNIPEEIGKIGRLETLDLSRNKLFGPIPPTMVSLTSLNHLNLSYNNFSGKIPTNNQFQTLDDPSIYAENPLLCGFPLPVKCPDNIRIPQFQGGNEDGDDDDVNDKLWFFLSVAIGFSVGFWGVCGTLVIKKAWRYAYFCLVDKMIDKLRTLVCKK